MEDNFKIDIYLPTNDFTKRESKSIKVTTKLYSENNSFIFKAVIPKYICDYLEFNGEAVNSKTVSSPVLSSLVESILEKGNRCLEIKDRENAKSEKYLAVCFNQSHTQERDSFNFASKGFNTKSSFQYFVVYKDIKAPNSLDRYNYKSDIRIGTENHNSPRKWHYFGINTIENSNFKLIRWTQEREDYFKNIQDKFVEINNKLNEFLGNLDEDKVEFLMSNKNLLELN